VGAAKVSSPAGSFGGRFLGDAIKWDNQDEDSVRLPARRGHPAPVGVDPGRKQRWA